MIRKMPFGLQRSKICEYISNRGHDCETTDVNSLMDKTLSYRENKRLITQHLQINTQGRTTNKQAASDWCDHLEEQCEIKHNKQACGDYMQQCVKSTPKRQYKSTKKCPIPVKGFCISPHTRTISGGKKTSVKRACHKPTHRKCR